MTDDTQRGYHVALSAALAAARERDDRYAVPLTRGAIEVGLYAPEGRDPQGPHDRDELYVIAAGSGSFICGNSRKAFNAGDLLFVPAGMEHRFTDFTADFHAWVIFLGPDGGEQTDEAGTASSVTTTLF